MPTRRPPRDPHVSPDAAPAAVDRAIPDAPGAPGADPAHTPSTPFPRSRAGQYAVIGSTYMVRHALRQIGCWFAEGQWGSDDATVTARAQAFVDDYAAREARQRRGIARPAPATAARFTVERTSATGGPYLAGDVVDTMPEQQAAGAPARVVVVFAHQQQVTAWGASDARSVTFRFWAECIAAP